MDIKAILYRPMSWLYKLACLVVATDDKKLVFMSSPDVSDNSWHLYQYLSSQQSGYRYIWICKDMESSKRKIGQISAPPKTRIVPFASISAAYHFLSARYIFHTHGSYFFVVNSRGPKLVNLWHGMPIKTIAYLDHKKAHQVAYSDFVVATSEYYADVMGRAFAVGRGNVVLSGLPRNDALGKCVIQHQDIRQKLGLGEETNLILWLPTYRVSIKGDIRRDSKSASFLDELGDDDALEKINEQAVTYNQYILVKLHPMDALNHDDELPLLSNVRIYKSNEWLALNLDLYEVLACSSALISDVSSVIIDYSSTKKPVCLIGKGLDSYTRDFVEGIDADFLRAAFFVANDLSDLLAFMRSEGDFRPNVELSHKLNSVHHGFDTSSEAIEDFLGI